MKDRIAVALGVGFALALLGAAGVSAKPDPGGSTVTLQNDQPNSYKGKVESDVPKCERRRLVRVFHDENANHNIDGDDFQIGEDRTNRKGAYAVTGNQAPAGDNLIALATDAVRDHTHCKKALVEATALED